MVDDLVAEKSPKVRDTLAILGDISFDHPPIFGLTALAIPVT
jgi:hypothetical protein